MWFFNIPKTGSSTITVIFTNKVLMMRRTPKKNQGKVWKNKWIYSKKRNTRKVLMVWDMFDMIRVRVFIVKDRVLVTKIETLMSPWLKYYKFRIWYRSILTIKESSNMSLIEIRSCRFVLEQQILCFESSRVI